MADGTFAWPEGQSGRSIARYGFDQPLQGDEMEHEMFLMDLCDLAKIDATRHIGTPDNGFDRADAKEIAARTVNKQKRKSRITRSRKSR